tara:strand:+ start:134 stop:562 length:429 start_codon:yes stop_codon:yes gene_type:complete
MLDASEIVIPQWQRGRVWSEPQKAAWVGFVLSGMPLPAIWLRQVDVDGGFRDEILDGQQRMSALQQWLRREIAGVIPWSGEVVWCLSEQDQRRIKRLSTPCMELPPGTTDEQAIDLYITLNTAGTPHTRADIQQARDWLVSR